jgi:hypothetical protein
MLIWFSTKTTFQTSWFLKHQETFIEFDYRHSMIAKNFLENCNRHQNLLMSNMMHQWEKQRLFMVLIWKTNSEKAVTKQEILRCSEIFQFFRSKNRTSANFSGEVFRTVHFLFWRKTSPEDIVIIMKHLIKLDQSEVI